MIKLTTTITGTSVGYCGLHGHVRVYVGSVAPETCSCGLMRYERHTCTCGNVHEKEIPQHPVGGVFRDDPTWDGFMECVESYRQQVDRAETE